MKFLLLRSNQSLNHAISKACCCSRASSLFSTTTRRSPLPPDNLRTRIARAGNPNASIIQVLDQWVDEGKKITNSDLQNFIKMLRKNRRYSHALQISEWMTDQLKVPPSISDIAVRLDLISKVCGLEEAEKFFESLPEGLRDYRVYGSLLSCYTQKRSLEKAETLMKKIMDLGYAKGSLPYNVMLSLYSQLKKYKELDELIQEMENRGINFDIVTYNIQMNAFVAVGNVEKMEKLLMKAEIDPFVSIDWHSYVVAANGYLKARQTEKVLASLKKSEHLIGFDKKFAYEVFMTIYASAGKKDEVNRIWKLYKQMGKCFNSGYLNMISSLMKLRDIDGAERVYKEWESEREFDDVRVPNVLIMGFCRNGLSEKAEVLINKLLESGSKPNASTWNHLAAGYKLQGLMDKAVEAIRKALPLGGTGRDINFYTLAACLEHVKAQGDKEAEKEILNYIKNSNFPPKLLSLIGDEIKCEKLGSGDLDEFTELADDDVTIGENDDDCLERK